MSMSALHGGQTTAMRTKVPPGLVLTGSAFTLIEILVVVGIIVILLGILMPVVSQLRNQAHKATTMTLINELLEAFTTYSNEDPRRLYPPPRADGTIGWNLADPTSCGAVLAKHFQASSTEVDRDPSSPTYQSLIDGWGRPMQYLLDGPVVDSTGVFQTAMMQAPAVTPAPVSDWNPTNLRPFAYIWSLGQPLQGLPLDAAPTNSGRWLYRHVAP